MIACCIWCAAGCAEKKKESLYTIGMVQITEDPMLDLSRTSVIEALREEGFEDGKNIRILYENAQGDIPNISLILKGFVSRKVDMIITTSTPCMAAAAQMVRDIPVVFNVAFSPDQIGIPNPPPNLTGAYDPFLMDDFVQMMRECRPSLKRIGILCNPSEPNARFGADRLRQACARGSIEVQEMPVFSSNDVLQAARSLAQKHIDAFAIAADNTVYLAMDALVKTAEERKIPLFVTEPSQVERGACAGLGVDFRQWGRESGRIAAAIIRGRAPSQIPPQELPYTTLYLNLKAAAAQQIAFPQDMIARATKVIQ